MRRAARAAAGKGRGEWAAEPAASLGSWRALAFGMGQIHDQPPASEIGAAQLVRGELGCFGACHRHEAESSLSSVGIHRKVNANDTVRRNTVDERLHFLSGGVVWQISYVECSVRRLLGSPARATRTSAGAGRARPTWGISAGRLGLKRTHGNRLASLDRAVEGITRRLGLLRRRQRDESETPGPTGHPVLG